MEGVGIYEYQDGRQYQGQWKKNALHGMGTYSQAEGHTYQGEFVKDIKHGYGIFKWNDGRHYEGYWANGKFHGPGVYTKPIENKSKFGIWEHGKVVQWMENTSRSQLIDMKMYLKDPKSRSELPSQCSFKAPNTFYPSLKKLDQELLVIEKSKDAAYKKVKEFL